MSKQCHQICYSRHSIIGALSKGETPQTEVIPKCPDYRVSTVSILLNI